MAQRSREKLPSGGCRCGARSFRFGQSCPANWRSRRRKKRRFAVPGKLIGRAGPLSAAKILRCSRRFSPASRRRGKPFFPSSPKRLAWGPRKESSFSLSPAKSRAGRPNSPGRTAGALFPSLPNFPRRCTRPYGPRVFPFFPHFPHFPHLARRRGPRCFSSLFILRHRSARPCTSRFSTLPFAALRGGGLMDPLWHTKSGL